MKAAPKKSRDILKNILPQLIFDNLSDGIIAIDLEGRILFINSSAMNILGKNLNGVGMDIYKYLPQDKKRFFKNGINKLRERDNSKELILKTAFKKRNIRALFSILKDDSGEVIGALISMSDITSDVVIEKKKTNLITDVVRIAKHEHQEVSLNLARADLISIVEKQLFELDERIKEKGVLIEKIFPPASEVLVKMDAERIEEVIAILLTNAVRYTPRHERIRISVDVKDGASKSNIELKTYNPDTKRGFIEVAMYNQCKGMSEKRLSSLFDKYEKIKNFDIEGNRSDSDGKVLNLPLARLLIESHEGKIWAEGGKNGCIFYFTIPIFKIDSYQENKILTVSRLPQEDEKTSFDINEKHNALVINDSPVVFKMYSEALEKMGYDILKGS